MPNYFKLSMELLPPEIIHHILILSSHNDILSFCQTNKKYHKILKEKYFWNKKAKYEFGNDAKLFFDNQSRVDAYLELLSQYRYFKGCEKFVDNEECFMLAVRNKNLDGVKNISLKYYPIDVFKKYKLCKDMNYIDGVDYFSSLMYKFGSGERPKEFMLALKGDRYKAIELCCPLNVNILVHVPILQSVLHGLAINGDIEAFKYLYEKFTYPIENINDIIHSAAMKNNEKIVDYLLERINDENFLYKCFTGAVYGSNFNLADRILKVSLNLGLTLDNFYIEEGIFTESSFEYLFNLSTGSAVESFDDSAFPTILGSDNVVTNPKFLYRCMKNTCTLEVIKSYYGKVKSGQIKRDKLYDKLNEKLLANAIKKGNTYMIKYILLVADDINKSMDQIDSLKYVQKNSYVIPTLLNNKADKNHINNLLYRGYDFSNCRYLNNISHLPRYSYLKLFLNDIFLCSIALLLLSIIFIVTYYNTQPSNGPVDMSKLNIIMAKIYFYDNGSFAGNNYMGYPVMNNILGPYNIPMKLSNNNGSVIEEYCVSALYKCVSELRMAVTEKYLSNCWTRKPTISQLYKGKLEHGFIYNPKEGLVQSVLMQDGRIFYG